MSEFGAFATWLGSGIATLGCGYVWAKASARPHTRGTSDTEVTMTARMAMARDGHQE